MCFRLVRSACPVRPVVQSPCSLNVFQVSLVSVPSATSCPESVFSRPATEEQAARPDRVQQEAEPQLVTGMDLGDCRAPSRIVHWHETLLGAPDSSWSISWERSSPDWGGVGQRVLPRLQWSAHDAMWCPVSSPPPEGLEAPLRTH